MKLRYKLIAIAAILGAVFMWGRHSKTSLQSPKTPAVLPANDREQIIVNPDNHTLTIVKPTGNEVLHLPDRTSTIDIKKDGTVSVTSPQFGMEHKVFIGGVFSDYARVGVGLDGFYWKRLDLGLGIADRLGNYVPVVFAKVTYNVWSNTQIGLTFDNQQHLGAILSVRI